MLGDGKRELGRIRTSVDTPGLNSHPDSKCVHRDLTPACFRKVSAAEGPLLLEAQMCRGDGGGSEPPVLIPTCDVLPSSPDETVSRIFSGGREECLL